METTRTEGMACLKCGVMNDSHSTRQHGAPKPGDISICLYCGNIAFYEENCKMRAPTLEEMQQLMDSKEWEEISVVQKAINKRKMKVM